MKFTRKALKALISEAIGKDRIVRERPWSVEHSFRLSGGIATDSEGDESPDGFVIVLSSENGDEAKVIVDTYWNPQNGDESGNALRVELPNGERQETYVPTRFDDGETQYITISNSPVPGIITVSHSPGEDVPPITYLAFENPFEVDEDIDFEVETLGNGEADVKLTRHFNI